MLEMSVLALLLAFSATLWSRTVAFETDTLSSFTSRCTTQYLHSYSYGNNATYSSFAPTYSPWVTTESYTTTAYSNYAKTEVLTPRASTTTLTATSTSTAYETIRDTSVITIYTTTEYNSYTVTGTEAVTSTTTVTISVPQPVTIPNPTGFTAVASANLGATLKEPGTDTGTQWDVEDVWWTEYDQPIYYYDKEVQNVPVSLSGEAPVIFSNPTTTLLRRNTDNTLSSWLRLAYRPQLTDQAQKVVCTYTVQSNNFATTTTIRRSSATTPTYTRTVYAATITSTSTVRAKPTNAWNGTISTEYPDWAYWNTTTFYTTLTTTDIETATETVVGPSTTSAYAACSTGNAVDTYDGYPFYGLAEKWSASIDNNTDFTLQSFYYDNTVQDCCARAAEIPSAIFYKYWLGACDIYIGKSCPVSVGYNNTSSATKVLVDVYYEPIPTQDRPYWYSSFTVGNGACGSINIQSLWKE